MKTKLIFALLFIFAGCATDKYLENEINKGKVRFFGGVYKDKKWEEKLTFQRISWFYKLTLYYDAILYRANKQSNFAMWFSPEELKYFETCDDLIVSVVYSADSKKISHANFINQLELNGYDFVSVNTFGKNLRSHPSFEDWKLQRHKIFGHCLRKSMNRPEQIKIVFPSFRETSVDF